MSHKMYCVNCEAWSITSGYSGECRRKSPICPPIQQATEFGRWPLSDATSWCLEWVATDNDEVNKRKQMLQGK